MLEELFRKVHPKYRSLPILGPTLDEFAGWLIERGYRLERVRQHLRTAGRIDRALCQRGFRALSDVAPADLRACAPPPRRSQDNRYLASTVHCLGDFLQEWRLLAVPVRPPTATERLLGAYRSSLEDVRGLARATVVHHVRTASELLEHLGYEARPSRLAVLTPGEIEAFVRGVGGRLSRETLPHEG